MPNLSWPTALLLLAANLPAQRSDTTIRVAGAARHPGGGVLVKELAIGDDSGADEYTFKYLGSVLLARDGSILIHEPGSGRGNAGIVRRYDSKGKFLSNVGRGGDGPGEYRSVSGLAQLKDGRLIIGERNRVNVYREDGKPDTTWTFMTSYITGGPTEPLEVDSRGVIWMSFRLRDTTTANMMAWPIRYLRLRADGRIIDTVATPELAPMGTGRFETRMRSGTFYSMDAPFSSQPRWTLHPDGYFATAMTGRYAIDFRVPSVGSAGINDRGGVELPAGASSRATAPPTWRPGQPVLSLRRNAPVLRVSDDERRDNIAYLKAIADDLYPGTPAPSIPAVPSAKPPLRDIQFSDDGRLWTMVSVSSEKYEPPAPVVRPGRTAFPQLKWREPIVYDVFERDGSYVGRVPLPRNAFIKALRGDEVWCSVHDEDDVQSLVKFRIQWR